MRRASCWSRWRKCLNCAPPQGRGGRYSCVRCSVCCGAGIVSVREQEQTVSFRHAAEESLARRVAAGRRPTALRDLRSFMKCLLRVPGLAERPLRSISVAECRRALEAAFAGSTHSYRKGRAILHSIFAYGQRQQWCRRNPVDAIETPQPEEREMVPLTLEQCRRLVEVAKTPPFRDGLPALGLMLFAGVRPGEVERLRRADSGRFVSTQPAALYTRMR